MQIEYQLRLVTRYIVTKYEQESNRLGSSSQVGEYDNPEVAYEVAYAMAKADHDRLGYGPGDERIKYPEPVHRPPQGDSAVTSSMVGDPEVRQSLNSCQNSSQ